MPHGRRQAEQGLLRLHAAELDVTRALGHVLQDLPVLIGQQKSQRLPVLDVREAPLLQGVDVVAGERPGAVGFAGSTRATGYLLGFQGYTVETAVGRFEEREVGERVVGVDHVDGFLVDEVLVDGQVGRGIVGVGEGGIGQGGLHAVVFRFCDHLLRGFQWVIRCTMEKLG